MKQVLLASIAVTALVSVGPVAQASVLSIDDLTNSLSLFVNQPDIPTLAGDYAPGSGALVTSNDAGNKITNFQSSQETLSFTFGDQSPWSVGVYFYRYFNEPAAEGGGLSDLFVIQGQANENPDYITFISATASKPLTGDITKDGPASLFGGTPSDLGAVDETGDWQLADDTTVDQYYIRSGESDVPEPATLAVLGTGLFGLGFARRKRG